MGAVDAVGAVDAAAGVTVGFGAVVAGFLRGGGWVCYCKFCSKGLVANFLGAALGAGALLAAAA